MLIVCARVLYGSTSTVLPNFLPCFHDATIMKNNASNIKINALALFMSCTDL